MAIHLILGGARSGKSRYAAGLATASGLEVHYIATARAGDREMAERIDRHRAERPAAWRVVEEPCALAATLAALDGPERLLLVDCLTLWLTNLLLADESGVRLAEERRELFGRLPALRGRVILIGNETGLGVIPMGELTRRFVDENGLLHQALARTSDTVTFMVAGLPMTLKGSCT